MKRYFIGLSGLKIGQAPSDENVTICVEVDGVLYATRLERVVDKTKFNAIVPLDLSDSLGLTEVSDGTSDSDIKKVSEEDVRVWCKYWLPKFEWRENFAADTLELHSLVQAPVWIDDKHLKMVKVRTKACVIDMSFLLEKPVEAIKEAVQIANHYPTDNLLNPKQNCIEGYYKELTSYDVQ